MSWVAIVAITAADFFLTPFILHRLGNHTFGLWILLVNLVGYYVFLDAGVRASLVRYVSRHKALGNREGVNQVVATAFYYYLGACSVVILATYLSVDWIARFFLIQGDVLSEFRSLYLLAGVGQALALPLMVFVSSLEAVGRIDQIHAISIACLGVRVICVVGVLTAGGGLFGIGAATILPQLLAYLIQIPLAIRAHQGLSLHPKWVRKSVFRDLLRFGSISFTVGIAERLRSYIYPVLIAMFLTPAAVTLFSLPTKILAFLSQGIANMTAIVNPFSSQLEAQNDFTTIRTLIRLSTQSALLVLAPVAAFLFVFGREFLTLWVGREYASVYPVLVLLTLGIGAAATQSSIQSLLFGIGRHKQLVWYRLAEGLVIALVGAVLLRIGSLEGFALVIAITLLLTSFVLVPRHLCRILNLSLPQFLLQGYLKPCILALPVAAAFLTLRSWFVVESWSTMIAVLLLGGFIYTLSLLFAALARSVPGIAWASLDILQLLEQKVLRTRAPKPFRYQPCNKFGTLP